MPLDKYYKQLEKEGYSDEEATIVIELLNNLCTELISNYSLQKFQF